VRNCDRQGPLLNGEGACYNRQGVGVTSPASAGNGAPAPRSINKPDNLSINYRAHAHWMPKESVQRATTRRGKCVLLTSSSIEMIADHGSRTPDPTASKQSATNAEPLRCLSPGMLRRRSLPAAHTVAFEREVPARPAEKECLTWGASP